MSADEENQLASRCLSCLTRLTQCVCAHYMPGGPRESIERRLTLCDFPLTHTQSHTQDSAEDASDAPAGLVFPSAPASAGASGSIAGRGDPTCRGAAQPVPHGCGARRPWSPRSAPGGSSAAGREAPARLSCSERECSDRDPAQPERGLKQQINHGGDLNRQKSKS